MTDNSTEEQTAEPFRCGFVAVVGRPNVGKSTLVNAIVGEKVSITSKKPQTTRDCILGIVTYEDAQLIFMDTPGFQTQYKSELTRRMNHSVRTSVTDVDAVVFVSSATGWKPEDAAVLRLIPNLSKNVIWAINKVDLLKNKEETLFPMAQEVTKNYHFEAIVPVSAERGTLLEDLVGEIKKLLPPSMPFYDPDAYTDKSPRFMASEIIREKAFRFLGEELPYGIAVAIETWNEDEHEVVIEATLYVERESHKAMVIGEKGSKLREITYLARRDIMIAVQKPVQLHIWVRVKRGWSNDVRALTSLGYGNYG